jgi:hypothetical protein
VTVSAAGVPGPGFFTLAKQFGKLHEAASKDEERAFWEKEKAAVYDTWQKDFKKSAK